MENLEPPSTKANLGQNTVKVLTEPVEDQPSEFKVTGFEMLDRQVKRSGNTGRIYLPKNWIGKRVKIIRVSKLEK
jgi:putative transposon-encoded protein